MNLWKDDLYDGEDSSGQLERYGKILYPTYEYMYHV